MKQLLMKIHLMKFKKIISVKKKKIKYENEPQIFIGLLRIVVSYLKELKIGRVMGTMLVQHLELLVSHIVQCTILIMKIYTTLF